MNEQQLAAMRQALEALESNRVMGRDSQGNYSIEITPAKTLYAITSIRAAIEQAEMAQGQEPCSQCHGVGYYDEGHENDDGSMSGGNYVECEKCKPPAAALRRLHKENKNLRSVMIAAAEEIAEHWDAHCDDEGYGPVNLMRRLEKGIPSEYAYKAGDFAKLMNENERLKAAQPALKPLTDEQIEAIWEADTTSADDCKSLYYAKLIARAIESAHGITGETK